MATIIGKGKEKMLYFEKASDHRVLRYDSKGMYFIEMRNNEMNEIPILLNDFHSNEDAPLLQAIKRAERIDLTFKCGCVLHDDNKRTIQNGSEFNSSFILRILKNKLYIGFMERGGNCQERIDALVIIPDELFYQAQDYVKQRDGKNEEKRKIALTNRS